MRIFVQNLEVVARHGIYEDERSEGRQFRVDLSVDIPDPDTDRIGDTVNYCDLSQIAFDVVASEQYRLVETVASEILDRVMSRWNEVTRAEAQVRKRPFGVPGSPKWVGVSLIRVRD